MLCRSRGVLVMAVKRYFKSEAERLSGCKSEAGSFLGLFGEICQRGSSVAAFPLKLAGRPGSPVQPLEVGIWPLSQ